MKAFQQAGAQQFASQTENREPGDVRELHFLQCALAPDLVQRLSTFPNLSRVAMVDMKPPLNDASFAAVLAALPRQALYSLDFSDNRISAFPAETAPFPALVRLILCNNGFARLEALGLSAARFPQLRTLDVDDNDCKAAAASGAWAACPTLAVVSGRSRSGEEHYDPSSADASEQGDEGGGDSLGGGDDEEEAAEEFLADGSDDDDDGSASGAGGGAAAQAPSRRRQREDDDDDVGDEGAVGGGR